MKPKLKHYEGSYAVVSLETGKAVAELDKNSELLDKINTRKYKLVPIGTYLAGLSRKENPMKRKPTPAQIAARERFAEMARSGAFKKKAAKARKAKANPVKKTVSQKVSQLTREGRRSNPRASNPVKPKAPKYTVQTLTSGKANWKRVAMFDSLEQAKAYAQAVPRAYKVVAVRVIDDK